MFSSFLPNIWKIKNLGKLELGKIWWKIIFYIKLFYFSLDIGY